MQSSAFLRSVLSLSSFAYKIPQQTFLRIQARVSRTLWRRAIAVMLLGAAALGAKAQSIATANLGANQVTLQLTSTTTGTGFFTLLPGSGTTCGTATQTAAGENSSGTAAIHGSLPLTASTAGSYTVRNLAVSTAYTACFTPDGTTAPISTNVNTAAAVSLSTSTWVGTGPAGFSSHSTSGREGSFPETVAGGSPEFAFSPVGNPYVSFQDEFSFDDSQTVVQFNGSEWVTVGDQDFTGNLTLGSSFAISPNGTPYLAYVDGFSPFAAIVMEFTGGAWQTVGNADFTPGTVYSLSLAFGPDGTPYLAFQDGVNGNKASVMQFNGSAWVFVGNQDFSPSGIGNITLAFSPIGTPYVAFQDDANGDKATVMQFNGTAWVTVGAAGFSSGQAQSVSLAFAPNGTPYVATQDCSTSTCPASVMEFSGGAWIPVGAAFTTGAGPSVSLAISPNGAPYVAIQDGANSNKASVMQFNGTSWVPAGNPDFSTANASSVSMAFSPNGTPYVLYQDAANGGADTMMQLGISNPTPITSAATNVASSTATLNGMVNDNGFATTITFEYGFTTTYGIPTSNPTTVVATSPAGGALAAGSGNTPASVNISGLYGDAIYSFRVNATANGITTYGNDQFFITGNPIPTITNWPTASPITLGQTLASSTLTGGTASYFGYPVTGTFAWTDSTIKPSSAGTFPNTYQVTFYPDSSSLNFVPATGTVSLTVLPVSSTVPVITSVSAVGTGQSQTITITGTGFGSQAAYTGNSNYIVLKDQTRGWQAGYAPANDQVTLAVSSWTNNQIVLQGFGGLWGTSNWVLGTGDQVSLTVYTAGTGAGPSVCGNITVGAGAKTCSTVPLPQITSVSAVGTGQSQTITITGTGFGNQGAYTGNSQYIALQDITRGWQAGYAPGNDQITLAVSAWTNNQIVLRGFAGLWGANNWVLGEGDQLALTVYTTGTGVGPSVCANITVGAGATTCSSVAPPQITSISAVGTGQSQTITITGTGFGTQGAYTGNSPYIAVQDTTRGWEAGYAPGGDQVTLAVSAWTNNQIVLRGFAGLWGTSNWELGTGDQVEVKVFTAGSGAGPSECNVTVGAGATTCTAGH